MHEQERLVYSQAAVSRRRPACKLCIHHPHILKPSMPFPMPFIAAHFNVSSCWHC